LQPVDDEAVDIVGQLQRHAVRREGDEDDRLASASTLAMTGSSISSGRRAHAADAVAHVAAAASDRRSSGSAR
jgi:hypothetical protein